MMSGLASLAVSEYVVLSGRHVAVQDPQHRAFIHTSWSSEPGNRVPCEHLHPNILSIHAQHSTSGLGCPGDYHFDLFETRLHLDLWGFGRPTSFCI